MNKVVKCLTYSVYLHINLWPERTYAGVSGVTYLLFPSSKQGQDLISVDNDVIYSRNGTFD